MENGLKINAHEFFVEGGNGDYDYPFNGRYYKHRIKKLKIQEKYQELGEFIFQKLSKLCKSLRNSQDYEERKRKRIESANAEREKLIAVR